MTDLRKSHLILYFTEGVSLHEWVTTGMFDREVGHYLALQPFIGKITFVTYGDANDLNYAERLNGITVVCNRWRIPLNVYQFLITRLYPYFWQRPWVAKSNQMYGALTGLTAAKHFGQKFLARAGYLPSNIMIWFDGESSTKTQALLDMERKAFSEADCCMVTTSSMADIVATRYGVPRKKINVIPNSIDTDTFSPMNSVKSNPKHIYYVGRLREEKNVQSLIEAVEGLDVVLHIIGSGDWRNELETLVQEKKLPVVFLGNIPNYELPKYINQGDIFVLPSHLEHHPKALLEAMSCGRAVIGTNVMGISDIIQHEENGLLCETNAASIYDSLQRLLSDDDLRMKIGVAAREYVVRNFPPPHIVDLEINVLKHIIEDNA